MEDGVFVAGHIDRRDRVCGRSGFSSDCIPRVAPRRSIRSRHCGMNEPIGSVQPVVLLKSLSKSYRARGRRFPLDRIDARIDAGECGADGAVRFGQIDSDEHYLWIGPIGRLSVLVEVGRLDDDELELDSQESDRVRSRTSIFCRD